jgi:hypothetical protein
MHNVSNDIITILQYLLPGFFSVWIFNGLTSFPKLSEFERIIQALIFTLIIQSLVFSEKTIAFMVNSYFSLGRWSEHSELLCSSFTAFFLGATFAYFANNDKFHKFARSIKITKETSYPSEWYGSFLNNVTYIVIHFNDERRLYGWPIAWPSEPDKGHFMLEQASWLPNDSGGVEIPLTGVSSIMVSAKDVKRVEFMKKTWEKNNGNEGT